MTVLHAGTSLVLVDVIAEETKGALHSRELLTDLKARDFRIFDNGHAVPIRSFDSGEEHTARPMALWLIVQCNEGKPAEETSGFMKDRTGLLLPALSHLDQADQVGVAHWCDDGTASVDLAPQSDPVQALEHMDAVLNQPVVRNGEMRKGELAMQSMIRKILAATGRGSQSRLPVYAFFYGDHSATYPREADKIVSSLLESAGIVYGLDQETLDYNPDSGLRDGQIWELVHFYSAATGGEFYSVKRPELFSTALAYILAQVHHRYVIGFKPYALDSKRHKLRVELTNDADHRYAKPKLRFRPEYVPRPLPEEPDVP
jgi:hypothetical protein